ncbi:MAG TPA: hypothetical protein VKG05_00240 [Steroidobacteraceae bacterium]|nr:hypothetical protein [Steroidobacteraceae bacterium]
MQVFEHLLKSYDIGDELDEIASADPAAYLRRCFAEALAAPRLSERRLQQVVVCALVVDAVVHDRDYEGLEPELIADWRMHYGQVLAQFKPAAIRALQRGQGPDSPLTGTDATAELAELERRLAAD